MSGQFSSANKDISIQGAAPKKLNPKNILAGMHKDVRKRWMMVGAAGLVGMSVMAGWVSSVSNPAPVKVSAEPGKVDTTPKGMSSQKDWKTQTGAEMLELRGELAASKEAQKELLARIEALRRDVATQAKTSAAAPKEPAANKIDFTLPPPPVPPRSLQATPAPATGSASMPAPSAPPTQPVAPLEVKRSPARSFVPEAVSARDQAQEADPVVDEMETNDKKGYLPAGSFVDGTLISGVEAFTGGTAQSMPQPVLIRLDANAILPNSANYQIKGCHLLASVWGDMSTERVFGRLATLSCVDVHNKLVLSEEVEGNLIDAVDGKNGIRGVLQDRQGAKLARSLLAGFAQGMATAFGSAQGTVSSTALGSVKSLIGADSVRAAGYGGANQAAQQLAEFYLKQAEATLPVIAVDASRRIQVLFTKSKSLKFETAGAYKVKPKDRLQVERP